MPATTRSATQPRSNRQLRQISNVSSATESSPDAPFPVSGGEMLRALRVRSGFTQAEAARSVGVMQGLLSRWEHNDCWPEIENLQLLCRILGATQGEICGLTEHGWKNQEGLPLDKDFLTKLFYLNTYYKY